MCCIILQERSEQPGDALAALDASLSSSMAPCSLAGHAGHTGLRQNRRLQKGQGNRAEIRKDSAGLIWATKSSTHSRCTHLQSNGRHPERCVGVRKDRERLSPGLHPPARRAVLRQKEIELVRAWRQRLSILYPHWIQSRSWARRIFIRLSQQLKRGPTRQPSAARCALQVSKGMIGAFQHPAASCPPKALCVFKQPSLPSPCAHLHRFCLLAAVRSAPCYASRLLPALAHLPPAVAASRCVKLRLGAAFHSQRHTDHSWRPPGALMLGVSTAGQATATKQACSPMRMHKQSSLLLPACSRPPFAFMAMCVPQCNVVQLCGNLMGWACPCCTLHNASTAAACGVCEQPRPPAHPPEVIDLLGDDEGEAPQPQQTKPQQKLGKQQRQEQQQQEQEQARQLHPQGHALQHEQRAAAQQPGGKAGAGMGAVGSKGVEPDNARDSPSSDDSFQIELSDVTSSKRRRTQVTAGSGSVQKRQLVGSAAAAGNGSGSSAETAVLAGAAGHGGRSAGPRLPPRQPRPRHGAPAEAALPRAPPAGREEPAGSITSGSPAPLQERAVGGQRQQEQHKSGGKRARDSQPRLGAADTPSPAGLAGLSLPPSKKQRRAAGAAPPVGQQLPAVASGRGKDPTRPAALAAQPSGLSPLPLRHARLSQRPQQGEQGEQAAATTETQAAAGLPCSAAGSPDLPQESPPADVGAAPAAAATGGSGPGRAPSRQLPPPARGLPVPLKPRVSSKQPGQHPREQEVQQQQVQQQQQPLVQNSPQLLARPSTAQGSSRGSPSTGSGLVPGMQQEQQGGQLQLQEGRCSPESVALGRQLSSSVSPSGRALEEQQATHDVRQELAGGLHGGEGKRQDEQQGPPAVGPQTFWRGLEAAYGVVSVGQRGAWSAGHFDAYCAAQPSLRRSRSSLHSSCMGQRCSACRGCTAHVTRPAASAPLHVSTQLQPCAPPARAPSGTGAAAGAAGAAPAWVRRARQSAVDATAALLAAADGCPPLELEGQGQHPRAGLAAAAQGWLAFRLAARLPEAAACSNAEEVLELGAAIAAAAGPPPPVGAVLAPRRQQGQGAAAGVGMCHAASRLLAAASRYQAHPMKLEERTRRWFQTRTPTFRKTLCTRLGDAFASTGGAGSAGGGRGGRRGAGAAPRGPSRLGKGSGAARPAKGGGQHRAPAGRSEMRGVQCSAHGTFCGTSSVHGRQMWLGTYRTQAAVGGPGACAGPSPPRPTPARGVPSGACLRTPCRPCHPPCRPAPATGSCRRPGGPSTWSGSGSGRGAAAGAQCRPSTSRATPTCRHAAPWAGGGRGLPALGCNVCCFAAALLLLCCPTGGPAEPAADGCAHPGQLHEVHAWRSRGIS